MATRGRPKGSSGEESRALILEIAAKEFAQNGYYRTKISTIVKGASLTQPTFYLYFKNKEAIFEELEQIFQTKLAKFVQESRLEQELELATAKERIEARLANLFIFLVRNLHLTKIGFFLSPKAEQIKQAIVAQIKDNLEHEVALGYFRKELDMRLVAESLVGMIERLTLTELLTEQKEPQEIARFMVDLLLFGMENN